MAHPRSRERLVHSSDCPLSISVQSCTQLLRTLLVPPSDVGENICLGSQAAPSIQNGILARLTLDLRRAPSVSACIAALRSAGGEVSEWHGYRCSAWEDFRSDNRRTCAAEAPSGAAGQISRPEAARGSICVETLRSRANLHRHHGLVERDPSEHSGILRSIAEAIRGMLTHFGRFRGPERLKPREGQLACCPAFAERSARRDRGLRC